MVIWSKIRRALPTTIVGFFVLLSIVGCQENRLEQDVSSVDVQVRIDRWDSAWFDMTPVTFRKLSPIWKDKYPELYQRYAEDVLSIGAINDSNLFNKIQGFVNDPNIAEVHQEVRKSYRDITDIENELTNAWRYFKFYFPEKKIPNHVALETGFNTPIILTEQSIGVSLEMFLGAQSKYYDYLQIPVYLRQRMSKQSIPTSVLKAWVETEFELPTQNPTLLDEMIHQGKVLYALDALFPHLADSLKINYSQIELEWAKSHEQNVWAHFIDRELLFTTDASEIAKFNRDGPFTVDLVKESPARMGHFIGWQIVRAYMDQQDEISLNQLFNEHDARKILKISKYKP